jgi:hypothetical protein
MAGPIYKLFMTRPTEAWYQLTEKEQNDLMAKNRESLDKAGVKSIVTCNSTWSNEQWMLFGLEEYADMEAVQKHTADLLALNWFRYIDSFSLLGTEWSPA